ncbi:nucleotidyltransferase family protein [Brevundimonas sp.]|jgi:dTDP-glucose pyrophosphorylase|uniref:nucleotidyltransferase family protein n=1 Tax=Brevundimonas sp. TaxID=1871086 RepID=UPI002E126CDB|nr:nucleotidyltransferase family protein [Brevundimonas sp.]
MKHWERALIAPDATLRDALRNIDATGAGIALVVDPDRRLVGTLSDGDIRRALIRGENLDGPCGAFANVAPATASAEMDPASRLGLLRSRKLRQLPLIDDQGRVVGLSTVSDFLEMPERTEAVVIMAGGRGTRLAELTANTPKPMLKVGPRPMLDTVVDAFAAQGFRRIFLSINYRGEQIEAHFGDGSERGLHIRYLREDGPRGTCGALSLLPTDVTGDVLVTNGDVLTKMDYGRVADDHAVAGAAATVVVRDYEMQVPFGVINADQGRVLGIEEKPSQVYRINAGVYVLSPSARELVPSEGSFDMPQLLQSLIDEGRSVRAHRAEGYWVDVGRMADFARANEDYGAVFEGG